MRLPGAGVLERKAANAQRCVAATDSPFLGLGREITEGAPGFRCFRGICCNETLLVAALRLMEVKGQVSMLR